MPYFFDTLETIPEGVGFPVYSPLHLVWLGIFVLFCLVGSLLYPRCSQAGRRRWQRTIALFLLADEAFKHTMLLLGDRWIPEYLPLHLCSINVFLIALHAWKPNDFLGNFLYTVSIPGAVAALLFPTWTPLPLGNFMHWHSFTIHILLAGYPILLTAAGDIRPQAKYIPKCLLLLLAMAVPMYGINLLLDTNFMFLMFAAEGNPLLIFENLWGNHLYGYPILISAVLAVMHLPPWLLSKGQQHAKINH